MTKTVEYLQHDSQSSFRLLQTSREGESEGMLLKVALIKKIRILSYKYFKN